VNLRLDLSYDGTAFHGWARQPGLRTVEGVLADALASSYADVGPLRVAGRTDTGVHALGQVCSVQVEGGPPADAAARALDALLPPDVGVQGSGVVSERFHARHSARARAYVYRVRTDRARAPLDANRVLHHPGRVDAAALDDFAAQLPGRHDFTAFTPTETQHESFTCVVERAEWRDMGAERWFVIVADRFLRHMVRTLVGTMLVTARGERDLAPAGLLAGASRSAAGPTAPPHGLYLAGVRFEGEEPGQELVGIH
jgi:tRNA pseudouridine38-40 synthase